MKYFTLLAVFFSSFSNAAYKDSLSLTVEQISVWGSSGHLLVQTKPRHNLEGLNCDSDFWLKLYKTDEGYQSMLSMLLAAQMSGKNIAIRAVDDSGTDFCRLERVVTYQ